MELVLAAREPALATRLGIALDDAAAASRRSEAAAVSLLIDTAAETERAVAATTNPPSHSLAYSARCSRITQVVGPRRRRSQLASVVSVRAGVEYLLVGGLGAQAHGASRATFDIDVIPATTDENWERLAAALQELGARLRVGGMTDEEARQLPVTLDANTLRSFGSSTWMTDAGPLDVLHDLPMPGGRCSYNDLAPRHVVAEIGGIAVQIAALDDIVAGKEYAGRDKDHDAPELRTLQRKDQSG